MKRFVFLLLFISNCCFAQQSEKEQNIRKLLEVTGAAQLSKQVMDQLIPSFKQTAPNVPEEFWTAFMDEIDMDELINKIVPLYDKYYSNEELIQLIKFYETPVGKKVVSVTPVLMQESMMIGQQWGFEISQKVIEKLQNGGYLKKT